MLISCEKCSTTYVLDDALIPPQGTPVQCTRCGHVFTARVAVTEAPQPPPAPAPKHQTMAFGMSAVPPAVPAPAKNTAMMFGAVPPPARSEAPSFGTAAANAAAAAAQVTPSAAAAPKPTLVFGGNAAPPSGVAAGSQTMIFGTPTSNAAAAAPPPPAPAAKQTMVFGAASVPASAPAGAQTMIFGTPASQAAGAAPAVPSAAARNETLVFGASAAVQGDPGLRDTIVDAPPKARATAMFGAVEAPAPAPARNQTMMFGRPAEPRPLPRITPGAVELSGMAVDEAAPVDATQRVDAEELPAALRDGPARQDRTQRFAMADVGTGATPAPGGEALQARHNRTQLFAMSAAEGAALGDAAVLPTPREASSVSFDAASTLPPDGPLPGGLPSLLDPQGVSDLPQPAGGPVPGDPGPVAVTLPHLSPVRGAQPAPAARHLDLTAEAPAEARRRLGAQQELQDDLAAIQRPGGGRLLVGLLVAAVLALAAFLLWQLFGRQLVGRAVPEEALQQTEQALSSLRLDDGESQATAVARLEAVLARHPGLVEAQAALVMAAAFRFDDANQVLQRDEAQARALTRSAAEPGEAGAEAQARLDAMAGRLQVRREQVSALRTALTGAAAALRALRGEGRLEPGEELALLRADALARGVQGDAEALAMAELIRQRGVTADNWADLVVPEFMLNGGSSWDEALQVLAGVRARASNSTFLRPLVLSARLHLMKGDAPSAEEDLTRVVALNARHQVAQELLASLKLQ